MYSDPIHVLNQYTNIATEGGRFILGEAPAANAVTVNSLTAARAGGLGFYWQQITANNSTAPLWSNDSVVSNGVTVTGRTWTPAATVAPIHDEDGNLKSDGRWDYLWDAENRLTQMKATTAALAAATASGIPCQKLDFAYDSQGRRVSKTVATSTNGTTWTFSTNQRFLYDGWNLIAEYSTTEAAPNTLVLQATHTWGIDLSGTPQGAGGVGGLLCSSLNSQPSTLNCYPAYDGNGNISAWIDGTGTLLGRMDFSPFGQLIAQYKFTPTGNTTLSRLAFGFSTKYTDSESGLLYYGYRYYDPVTGRWPSRDPIEERGGVNLYGFVGNDGVNWADVLGLEFYAGFIPKPDEMTDDGMVDTSSGTYSDWKGTVDDAKRSNNKAKEFYKDIAAMSDSDFKAKTSNRIFVKWYKSTQQHADGTIETNIDPIKVTPDRNTFLRWLREEQGSMAETYKTGSGENIIKRFSQRSNEELWRTYPWTSSALVIHGNSTGGIFANGDSMSFNELESGISGVVAKQKSIISCGNNATCTKVVTVVKEVDVIFTPDCKLEFTPAQIYQANSNIPSP